MDKALIKIKEIYGLEQRADGLRREKVEGRGGEVEEGDREGGGGRYGRGKGKAKRGKGGTSKTESQRDVENNRERGGGG